MKNKQRFLKNLLTTASVLAVTAMPMTEAFAGGTPAVRVIIGNANTETGAGMNKISGDDAPVDNFSVLTHDGLAAHTVELRNRNVAAMDVDGTIALGKMTVTADSTLGSVVSPNSNNKLTIEVAEDVRLELSGTGGGALAPTILANNYSALPPIHLKGLNSRLTTSGEGIMFVPDVIADENGEGDFSAEKNVTIIGNIGTASSAIQGASIAEGKNLTVTGDVYAREINGNGTLFFAGNSTVSGLAVTGAANAPVTIGVDDDRLASIHFGIPDDAVDALIEAGVDAAKINPAGARVATRTEGLVGSDEFNFHQDFTWAIDSNGESVTLKGAVFNRKGGGAIGAITANVNDGKEINIVDIGAEGTTDDPYANALRKITVTGGGDLRLSNSSYVKDIDISGSPEGRLVLGVGTNLFNLKNVQGNKVLVGGNVRLGDDNAGVTFSEALDSVEFNGNRQLTFANSTNITALNGFTTATSGEGVLVFTKGQSSIDGVIGSATKRFKVLAVDVAGTVADLKKEAYFSGDVFVQEGAKLVIGADLHTQGSLRLNGGTLDVGLNSLRADVGSIIGANTLNITVNDTKNGVVALNGATFDIGATITLKVADQTNVLSAGGETITFLKGTVDIRSRLNDIELSNSFHRIEPLNYALGNTSFVIVENAEAAIEALEEDNPRLVELTDPSFLSGLKDATSPEAQAFRNEIGRIPTDAEKVDVMIRRANPLQAASSAVGQAVAGAVAGVAERVAMVSMSSVSMAAGDECEATKYGAWVNPFYSQGTQDLDKNTPGYTSRNLGATVGFDTAMSDNTTIGAALTAINTNMKYKNFKAGDKTKANTFLISAYGMQKIGNTNWFVQGIASIGRSKINNTESTNIKSNFNSTMYGIEVLGGYNYRMSESAMITPMLGLAYNGSADGDYTQTGGTSNFAISKKAVNKVEVIAGARAVTALDLYDLTVTPEAHAFVRQALGSTGTKVNARLGNLGFTSSTSKSTKTMFNIGIGATVKNGMVDYSAGYDMFAANKYMGHQGTFKVRVNF